MHRPHARAGVLAVTSGLLLAAANVVLLAATQQPAAAATQNMTMSYTFPNTTPTGSIAGIDVSALQGGFVNVGIPWNGQIANNTGVNRLMANYWNPASTFAAKPNGVQTIALDDQTGAYHLSNFNASTYFPNGRPGAPCNGAAVGDPCHWTTVNPHFPSDYPAIYKGCHFTQCSAGVGAPFPMTLNSLVSLDSVWQTTVPNPGVGTFDVAYDIWLDRGVQATMPAGAATIGQNDGAEVMLWVGNHGYAPNGTSLTNPITPAGTKLPVTYADSAGGLWDVWIGRQDPNGPHPWNIVTYVKQIPTTNFQLDTKQFLDDALTYNTAARPGLAATLNATCPAQNDGTLLGECVSPSWWLTSVQTGFEIWDLPADGGASQGSALGTTQFSVKPMSVLANDPNGVTGRARAGNSPIIHWQDTFALKYASCAGGTATYSITPGTGTPPINGTLTETPAGSGVYVATVAPLIPGHDGSTIAVNVTCPGGVTDSATKPVFIDPSGHIQTTNGLSIQNATVTILRSTSGTAAGPYAPAPAADIQPTTNPQTTDATGAFRWDVLAGFYEVQATATGCNTVTTAPLPVPPPQVDLLLRLSCTAAATGVVLPGAGGGGGTGLPVTVAVRPPGITPTGYCADITVTNNTSAPVDWNVSFPVPGGYHINQAWNMVYTQVGTQATNVHANPANPWNKTLQPGQSTTSTGFCANP